MRIFVAIVLCLCLGTGLMGQPSRGLSISMPASKTPQSWLEIRNIALVIGTSDYAGWKHLPNPVFDAEAVNQVLTRDYGYEVTLLKNPTKDNILDALFALNEQFEKGTYGTNTNLLIFIAGHGGYDGFMNGYIVPADAKSVAEDRYHNTCIPYDNLRSIIDNISARHTLVVLDACFGGTFDQLISNSGHRGDDAYALIEYTELLQRKMPYHSRKYITSGGKEYVPDGRPGFHSPFAYQLIRTLRDAYDHKEVITFSRLCDNLSKVKDNEPRAGDFGNNDPGSDFILLPLSTANNIAPAAINSQPVSNSSPAPATITTPMPATHYRTKAEAARASRDYCVAAEHYRQLIDKYPSSAPMDYLWRGCMYFYCSDYKAASDAFAAFEARYPDQVAATFWHARALAAMDEDATAGTAAPFFKKWLAKVGPTHNKKEELKVAFEYMAVYYGNKGDKQNEADMVKKLTVVDPASGVLKQIADSKKQVGSLDEIMEAVDIMPKPLFDLSEYISNNMKYPDTARENNIEGRVIVKFVVNEDGHVSDATIARGVHRMLDDEAMRVVMGMPKWSPGISQGKPVKVYFTLPLLFKLED